MTQTVNICKGLPRLRQGIVILGFAASLSMSGCGAGLLNTSTPTGPSSFQAAPLSGIVHGGANPVVGATVKLYTTGSSSPGSSADGYGIGTFRQEATQQGTSAGQDTDTNGNFSFAGGYTCPAKQFVYIVASGGNPGAGTNTSAVLVTAVGRCEDIASEVHIAINELTTVAAAYALGQFTTVTCGGAACTSTNLPSASNPIAVGIGAPVTANSQTFTVGGKSAGCISNSFYTTTACPTTSTAALYHAFLNAANLVTAVSSTALTPPRTANTAIVAPGTTVSPPVVNNALINAIANTLVACVNSTGASSTACATVFGATTINSVAPTNSFQAMINLAQNPTLAGTSNPSNTNSTAYTPAQFVSAATPTTSYYTPALPSTAGSFRDFELSIFYPGEATAPTAGQGLGYTGTTSTTFQGLYDVFNVGADINDDIYVGVQTGTSTSTTGNLVSFSSSGTLQSYTLNNTTTAQFVQIPSPDGLGNVYTCSPTSAYAVAQWTVDTSGNITSAAPLYVGLGGSCEGLAVDLQGNVWASSNNTATGASGTYNLYEVTSSFPTGSSSTTCPPVVSPATAAANCAGVLDVNNLSGISAGSYPQGVAVDPNQNIWFADMLSGGAGEVSVLQNTGSVSSPTYTFQSCITGSGTGATTASTPASCASSGKIPASAVSVAAGGEQSFDIAFAPSGSSYVGWVDNNTASTMYSGISEITPSPASSTEVSSLAQTKFLPTVDDSGTAVALNSMASDGAGNIFSANQGGAQIMETTAAGVNIGLYPCVAKTAGSSCTSSVVQSPRGITVDSTGSVWLAAGTNGMVQIIGLAAPTWPQLSLGKVGMPK